MSWTFRTLLAALAALVIAGCGGGTAAEAGESGKPGTEAAGGSAEGGAEEGGTEAAAKPEGTASTEAGAKPGEAAAGSGTAAKPGESQPAGSGASANEGELKINIKVYPGAKPWTAEGIDGKIVQKTEFSEFYSNIYTSADAYEKVASWYRKEMKGAKEEPAKGEGIEITTFLAESGKETRIATVEKAGKDPVRITLSRMVQL